MATDPTDPLCKRCGLPGPTAVHRTLALCVEAMKAERVETRTDLDSLRGWVSRLDAALADALARLERMEQGKAP